MTTDLQRQSFPCLGFFLVVAVTDFLRLDIKESLADSKDDLDDDDDASSIADCDTSTQHFDIGDADDTSFSPSPSIEW